MIDASCSLWDEECSVRGSCWVYNNLHMSVRLFVITIVLKIIALGFNILGIFLYKPPKLTPESQPTQVLANENMSNNSNSSCANDFDLKSNENNTFL